MKNCFDALRAGEGEQVQKNSESGTGKRWRLQRKRRLAKVNDKVPQTSKDNSSFLKPSGARFPKKKHG